jgi:hypothetical protein
MKLRGVKSSARNKTQDGYCCCGQKLFDKAFKSLMDINS